MNNLQQLADQLYFEMFGLVLGIPVVYKKTRWLGSVVSELNDKGESIPTRIEINSKIDSPTAVKLVLKHELIHVYLMRTENYSGHRGKFKELADKFNIVTISPTGRKLYATIYPQILKEE